MRFISKRYRMKDGTNHAMSDEMYTSARVSF